MHRYALIPVVLVLLASPALAGGGPETTLVVVNGRSPVSKRIANEYVALRDIPASHLVHLNGIPTLRVVSLDFFKERIWAPVQKHMEEQGLVGQIDLVVYSADLPYGVNFRSVLGTDRPGKNIGGIASLTGVTYLARHVLAGDPFWDLRINGYYRVVIPGGTAPRPPTRQEMELHSRANRAILKKEYAAAAEVYEAFLAEYPYASSAWYNLACCRALLGKPEAALEALEAAVDKGFANASLASKDPDLASIRDRPAFRLLLARMDGKFSSKPAHGFRSTYAWTGGAEPSDDADSRRRYYLSTRLGYTGFKGNTVPEILECLRSAAGADGTHPDGTVYICKNGNVRSTSREPFFSLLVSALTKLGRKVEVLERGDDGQTGIVPVQKDDVIGAVVGTANFSWGKSRSRILPGAICEHLTSHGANFGTPGQPMISEFFRFGAAGSSGTVMEPLSLHGKFPNPMIHAYYAEGCSLAEAFFQSIWGPYQLMVAGDGLARPFATFRKVEYEAPKSPWKGRVTISPKGEGAAFELWVDGRRVATGGPLELDTTTLDDGHHEVRVVAVEDDRSETRSYARFDAVVANRLKTKRPYVKQTSPVLGETVSVRVPGAREIRVYHGSRLVGSSKGMRCSVDTAELGPGPVRIVPVAVLGGGGVWRCEPVDLVVEIPKPVPSKVADRKTSPGLLAEVTPAKGKKPVVITYLGAAAKGKKRLQDLPALSSAKRLELEGEIHAPEEGMLELVVNGSGKLTISVARRELAKDLELGPEQAYLPVSLGEGWHPIRIEYTPRGRPRLEIMITGDVPYAAPRLRH